MLDYRSVSAIKSRTLVDDDLRILNLQTSLDTLPNPPKKTRSSKGSKFLIRGCNHKVQLHRSRKQFHKSQLIFLMFFFSGLVKRDDHLPKTRYNPQTSLNHLVSESIHFLCDFQKFQSISFPWIPSGIVS